MTVFRHALKRIFSSKLKLAVIFLCPALFTAMFMTTTRSTMTILVADNDHTALSEKLAAGLGALDKGIEVILVGEDEAVDKIMSYQADEAFTIPKGFEDAILSGKTPSVEAFYVLDMGGAYYAKTYIDGFVSDMKTLAAGAGYDKETFGAALTAYSQEKLSAKGSGAADGAETAWAYGSLGFLVQFMLYMSIITAGVILEDRNSGVYYRTFFAPVSLKRYYAENLLAFLAVGVLQAVISIILLITVFGMNLVNPLAILALYIVFTLVCIALGMWLITFFKRPMFAYLSILFITTPLVMLGGCYWPSSFMPDLVVKIARFLPTSWVMQAVDKVLNSGANLGGIGLEILVLLLFAGIFMAAGLVKKVDIAK